jgi:hypothetical protein
MAKFLVVSAVVLFGFIHEAHAFCTPGEMRDCIINGQPGTQTCGSNGQFGPCIPNGGFDSTGPSDVAIPDDLIYKTFGFAFVRAPVQGVLFSKSNAPVGGQQVVVELGGATYRTFTNPDGEFALFGPTPGAMQLHVAGSAAMTVSLSHDPIVITVP